jgi:hypothetical protein
VRKGRAAEANGGFLLPRGWCTGHAWEKHPQPAMGIVLFLVLALLIVVLIIRTRNEANRVPRNRLIQIDGLPQKPSLEESAKSPFDAGELTQRQKDQDDWDARDRLLQSDRFWSERQSVLLPVVLDYVSAKGECSEREVDIRYFQLAATEDGQETIHLDCFCHLRNARRYFLAHRARSITVRQTGEVFTALHDFRDFLFDYYANTAEGQIDCFFAEQGADFAEIALYLGRVEGKLKARAKNVLLPVLADLSGASIDRLKDSIVCKTVLKVVGTDGKDYRAATDRLLNDDSQETKAALKKMLEELSVDKNGKPNDVIAPLAAKILKKIG